MLVEWNALLFALIGGVATGIFYFGGLWWTVKRLTVPRQPVLWGFGSFLIRAVVSLAAFYMVTGLQWERLAVCLFGFMSVKVVLVRLVWHDLRVQIPKEGIQ